MSKLNELAVKLTAVNDRLLKAHQEIIDRIAELSEALGNVDLPEEAETALAALETAAQALDDLNPDAPPADPEAPAE